LLDPPQRPAQLSQCDDLLFLIVAQDIAHALEPNWLVAFNVPNAYLSLAGFEVTFIGRFWVTAEAPSTTYRGNPATKLTKLYRQAKSLHPEIQPRFLQAAQQYTPDYHTMFLMLLHTGVRSGECARLQWATSTSVGNSLLYAGH